MIEKGKQITLSQRIKIEEMLNQKHKKFEIAIELIELAHIICPLVKKVNLFIQF